MDLEHLWIRLDLEHLLRRQGLEYLLHLSNQLHPLVRLSPKDQLRLGHLLHRLGQLGLAFLLDLEDRQVLVLQLLRQFHYFRQRL